MKIIIKTTYIFAFYKILSRAKGVNISKALLEFIEPEGVGAAFHNILIMHAPHLGLRDQKAAAIKKLLGRP